MKKVVAAAIAAGISLGGLSVGVAEARPAKPNTACMQFGIGVLQDQSLLPVVAEYPIGSGNVFAFSDVLAIMRDDPALANQGLTDYAIALGIATDDFVAALNAACPPTRTIANPMVLYSTPFPFIP